MQEHAKARRETTERLRRGTALPDNTQQPAIGNHRPITELRSSPRVIVSPGLVLYHVYSPLLGKKLAPNPILSLLYQRWVSRCWWWDGSCWEVFWPWLIRRSACGSAHRRRLFPGAAWMVCRDKWVEGLCWVHLGYLQPLSGTQRCFIQPFLSNLAWLTAKELTTFRCWEEGTGGGQHHHPDFKRSISPQTKANLPRQSAAQES